MKKELYQITDADVEEIIKDLMKKCDTNPKDIAEYIGRNGDVIGQIYNIKSNLKQINEYEKEKADVDGFVKFYKEQYHKTPSKREIDVQMKFYQEQIDFYKKELKHYLLSDSVFYDMKCKVLKFNNGKFDKIFTPKQVEFIYKVIEKYVVENKKTEVIFAEREYKNSCIEGLDKKHLPFVLDLIYERCDLPKILKMYRESLSNLGDIKFETKLKDLVIKEGKINDLYAYLLISTNLEYKYKNYCDDALQHKQNNQQVADKMHEYIKATKDKKTCRKILLGLNNNDKSDEDASKIVNYFDKKELLKTYIDFCSKKEIDEFISEIASNKYSAEHPPVNDYVELC